MRYSNKDIIDALKDLDNKIDSLKNENITMHDRINKEMEVIRIQTNETHEKVLLHQKLLYGIVGAIVTIGIYFLIKALGG